MSTIEEQLSQLREQYLSGLEERINEAQNAWDNLKTAGWNRAHAAQCHQIIHKLTGSAGSYGLTELSEVARTLEHHLSVQIEIDKPPESARRAELAGLLDQVVALALSATTTARKPYRTVAQPKPMQHTRASNTIYIVDDDADIIRSIESRLQNEGYLTRAFTDLKSFQSVCCEPPLPAAVIMDMIFPEGSEAGSSAIGALKCRGSENLPVIFISVRDDINARLAALRSGATRYLTKPLNLERLVAMLDDIILPPKDDPYRVLLVDDDPDQLNYHAQLLSAAGITTRTVSDPLCTFDMLDEFKPDVVVLDVHMPKCTGMELAVILREREECAALPILFLSTERDTGKQMLALDLGGDDFFVKPVTPAHFTAAVAARAKRARLQRTLNLSLRSSLREQHYQQFALDQHAIVSKADVTGCITQVNDRFCEISGYRRVELLGQNHRLLKSGVHNAEFYKTMWQTISDGRVWQGELCNQCKNGNHYWVESTIVPFLDEQGKPYQYVSVRTDITSIKEAELALRDSRERLTEAQRIAHLGNWEANLIDGDLSWSDEVYRIFGQHPGAYTPTYESFFSMVHPDDRELVLQSEQRARETGIHDVIHRIVRADGSIRIVRELAEMNYAADGTPAKLIGTVQDVTSLKEAEQALITAKDDAENANRAKSEFLSSMSHELRTPMNAILGFAQLMEIDTTLTEEHREGVDEILKGGRHLLELINEVLDLARIESGRLDLAIEPVACANLIDECISLVRPLAEHRGISLYADHGACGHSALRADRMRLKQVLLNLLSNAVKYNRPEGSVAVEILPAGTNMLRVCVTDTGPGIATKRHKELFHPFNRLGADQTDVEGTGIGLVISKQLVEMMSGSIGFDSAPGEGSTFWVDMPIDTTEAIAPDAVAPNTETTPHSQVLHTVLYVEDNPVNLKLVAQLLAHRPHIRLLTSHLPELGLDLARTHLPDLILLDISMPGMDGYTLLNEIRKLETARRTPVIAITANAMASDIQRGLAAGFDEYLTKPLDVPRFLVMVDRLLSLKA